MILMRIEDFKAKPSVAEYLLLYLATSSFLIIGAASLLGNIDPNWAWASFAILAITAGMLNVCRYSRLSRAQGFYKEWLSSLQPQELSQLQARLKTSSPERKMLQACHFNHNNHQSRAS